MQDRPGQHSKNARGHQHALSSARAAADNGGESPSPPRVSRIDKDDQHRDGAYIDQQLRQAQELGPKVKVERARVRQTQSPAPARNGPDRATSSPRRRQPGLRWRE